MLLAERLAAAAGAVIRGHWRQPFLVEQKKDESPVTIADREAELAIRAVIERERPQDGIWGEEFGATNPGAALTWVIDPIDGTKSFMTGRPIFGTLIACLEDGRPILGVIDQPIIADRWVGARGRPTLLNGRPVRTRACPELAAAILATTQPDLFPPDATAGFARLRARVRAGLYGGDCYSYGQLAAGFLDIVAEPGMKLHDYAALVPVVEGAGGCITDWQGRRLGAAEEARVAATGDPRLHDSVLELLR